MHVWRRLHVFVRLFIVLCAIGDVVPASESPLWRVTSASISPGVTTNTRDTKGVAETTRHDEKAGNLQNLESPPSPTEGRRTTAAYEMTPDAKTLRRGTKGEKDSEKHSVKSSNLVELDFSNVIDVTTQPTKHRKRILTDGSELPDCKIVEPPIMNNDSNIVNTEVVTHGRVRLDEEEYVVEDLEIIDSTSHSLTVSWKRPNGIFELDRYTVEWYKRTVPISGCRIVDPTEASVILIEELEACTGYDVKIMPFFKHFATGKELVVPGVTKLDVSQKTLNLKVTATGMNWIEISWEPPNDYCIAFYTVKVTGGLSYADETQIHAKSFNKSDLTSGRTYDFNLTIHGEHEVYGSTYITGTTIADEPIQPEIADCLIVEPHPTPVMMNINGNDKNSLGTLQTQQTKEGEISVEGLGFKDVRPDALVVEWNKPNGTVEVKDYIIQWSLRKDIIHSCRLSNETFSYAITTLDPCSTYTVEVLPRLELINGSKRVVTGTTGLDVAKHLTDFKIANNSTDWLKVSWSMPSTDCVKDYLISVCDGIACSEERINTTTFNKTDLSPCRTYNFNLTVFAASSAEAYGSTNIQGTTNFLKPGRPSPAETESGNYTLKVSWQEPIGHTCVDHYRVTWNHENKVGTINTNETMVDFTKMEACAMYEIVIVAVAIDNMGESLPEIIISNMTAPAVTDSPVQLQDPRVTADSVTIYWLIHTNKTNNCQKALLIVECNGTEILGEGYESVNQSFEYTIHSGTTNKTIYTSVEKLSSFTKYICKSYTKNVGGRSEDSQLVPAQTLQAVPMAPQLKNESESNVTNTSITLQWKKPLPLPGILTGFSLSVIWEYRFYRPTWCNVPSLPHQGELTINNIAGNATSYVYNVEPFTRYTIIITAATEAGQGNASEPPEKFDTKPGAPGEVTDLRYIERENENDPNILDSTVIWGLPCNINGERIEYFNVIGNGSRDGFEHHSFTHIINNTENYCINDTCTFGINNLREEHEYSIRVAAKVANYNDFGAPSNKTFLYPAGIPPQPDANYTDLISIDPYKARRTTSSATVLLPIFPNTGGEIVCYAVIVSKFGYNNETYARLTDMNGPDTASWKESLDADFEIPYQAKKFCNAAYPSYIVDYGSFKAVKFVLGENDECCSEISSNREERSYCNGPLNPDTWYHVRMRAFTAGGYRDSIAFKVKTNAELDVATVVGTVFGILFLGILATMMLLVRKCSLQAVLRRFLHSDMPGSPVPAPFTRRKFIAHCQQLADNPGKLSNEYQLLQTLSVDLQMPTNAACLQANRKKNRYTDILPYDFSRVKLEVIDNDPNTDYINASFIKGFTGDEDYIACQGPKEETTYDFWRMIDQYDVKLIVMLTQLVEKNKEKCHQYFPTIRETFTYENMAIRCSMELDYRTYTQRTLVLQKENEKRNIIHLHFKDWPDHDVPEDFDPMINFCQIMRRHMDANRGLVVVHCSAGIGRTGTLIAIDILLQHIKDNRKLDVFGTVYRLRHHRINMVQRESQYAYIYNCIRQVLKNPYFSKTYKPPSVEAIGDSNCQKKKEASDSSTNLVSSIETLKKSSLSTSVESAEPIYQNSSASTPKSQTCYSFNGLRCAKSTSAIDTRPYQKHIGRYNTHDHLIINANEEALIDYSEISLDVTESEGSTTSIYENMQPLSRSKSAQAFGRNEDPCVTQKLLEHDTSL